VDILEALKEVVLMLTINILLLLLLLLLWYLLTLYNERTGVSTGSM